MATKKATKKKATKKKAATKSKRKGNPIVGKIARKAKKIRKSGEKWTSAIKRAAKLVAK